MYLGAVPSAWPAHEGSSGESPHTMPFMSFAGHGCPQNAVIGHVRRKMAGNAVCRSRMSAKCRYRPCSPENGRQRRLPVTDVR